MAMTFVDNRPEAYKGDLPLETLKSIMKNSIYNSKLPFGQYNSGNAVISITKGAHTGTYYPDLGGNYYFDIMVNGGPETHCLIKEGSTVNSNVLAVR